MKIAHLYPKYHANVGDHLVQRGILRLLREHLGDFAYTPLSTRLSGPSRVEPTGISSGVVAELKGHDLLVIGGSNLYEVAGGQWGVAVDRAALDRLGVPVLLIGIGGGWSFAFPDFPAWPPAVADQIRVLHARAIGSSVRDDMTQRLLERHGIGSSVVTGCPAAFLAADALRPAGRGVVGVAFLPRRMYADRSPDPRRWRNPAHVRRRQVTGFFRGLLKALPKRGYEVRLLVHDAADLPLARRIAGTSFFYSEQPEELLDAIAACDVIVGFRLHACIAALGVGVPSIPILLDGRSHAFVETFGMTEHAVPCDPASLALTLHRVGLAMGEGRRFWSPVIARRDQLRETMQGFLASALSSSRAAV